MLQALLFLTGLLSLCSAQHEITSLFLPFGSQTILASIVGSGAGADDQTTYALACPPDSITYPGECNLAYITVTEGPGTAHYTLSASDYYMSADCSLTGSVEAWCTATETATRSRTPWSNFQVTQITGTEISSLWLAVTITDKLPDVAAATVYTGTDITLGTMTGVPSTTSNGIASQTATPSAQKSTASSSSTVSQTNSTTSNSIGSSASSATAASKTSSAGISQITGNSGWAIGGVAIAMAVVVL